MISHSGLRLLLTFCNLYRGGGVKAHNYFSTGPRGCQIKACNLLHFHTQNLLIRFHGSCGSFLLERPASLPGGGSGEILAIAVPPSPPTPRRRQRKPAGKAILADSGISSPRHFPRPRSHRRHWTSAACVVELGLAGGGPGTVVVGLPVCYEGSRRCPGGSAEAATAPFLRTVESTEQVLKGLAAGGWWLPAIVAVTTRSSGGVQAAIYSLRCRQRTPREIGDGATTRLL